MNQLSGAEAVVRMLEAHGVSHIFGLCGDTSLPFYDALYRIGGNLTHILTRDERSAAYMADAYARVSGRVGVCEGPSGGGATYILPGVVEANDSSVPLLAITTDIATSSRGRYALTELDQASLFRTVTKWNKVLNQGAEIPGALRAAFTAMTTGRPGAAHISLPFDVQNQAVDEAAIWADSTLGAYPARRTTPDPKAAVAAAELLLAAALPVIVCGGGVVIAGAESELQALAEMTGAPVAMSVSGQGSLPEDHPLALGVVGSNGGTPEIRAVVAEADLVLFVGCRAGSVTTERWCFPAPGGVKVIHIDVDSAVIGANYPTDIALVGDARLALANLGEAVAMMRDPDAPASGAARVAKARDAKFAEFDALARSDELPIRPERVISALQSVLPEDAVVIADPGTPCPYISAYYRFVRPGRHFISNRAHGALGYGLPAVIGAAFGRPGAKCVALMGDGGFGFAAGELETLARLGRPVTLIVFANGVYGWIKAGQKSGYDARYYSVDFGETDHGRVAEAYGLKAWRVEQPDELEPALAAAVEADGPTLVDIVCQPLQEANAPVSEWVA